VDGPRFHAFLPLGSRSQLENDTLKLAEAYQWNPIMVKQMSSSERHRYVKMKAAIEAERNARRNNQTTMAMPSTSPTGLDQRASLDPAIALNYGSGNRG